MRYGICEGGEIACTVVDAELGAFASIASRALARDEVIGTPLAKNVFDLFHAIWLQDQRLDELMDAASWRVSTSS
jgi:hypothetical protein